MLFKKIKTWLQAEMHNLIDLPHACDPDGKAVFWKVGPDLHLLRLGCSPEVHLARGHLMHLKKIG